MKKKRLVGIVMLFLTLVLVFACGPKKRSRSEKTGNPYPLA